MQMLDVSCLVGTLWITFGISRGSLLSLQSLTLGLSIFLRLLYAKRLLFVSIIEMLLKSLALQLSPPLALQRLGLESQILVYIK